MELIIFFFIIIAALSSGGNKKKKTAQQKRTNQAVSALRNQIVPPTGNRRASADPGRVSAASVARNKQNRRPVVDGQTVYRGKPQTKRERFERESAYETSNVMDVRYTSNGCGCTTGKGNASSGSRHGSSSAIYDEARFFKESREICSGNWS